MSANPKMNCLILAVAALTSLSLVGCGSSKAKNGSLVLDSTGTSGTSTTPTSANFTLGATMGYPAPAYMHNAASADWSGACQVSSTNLQYPPVNAGFIGCYLEVSEFDLYLSSMALQYSAPAGSCDYVEVAPYVAWQYQANIGATTFIEHIDASANMTITNITPGNPNLPAGTGVKVQDNAAVCQYDYSKNTPSGPNCCPGKYAATVITMDSTGGTTTSSAKGDWGGKIGNCAAGPGVEFATTTNIGTDPINNMPRVLEISATTGYSGSVAISSPLSKGYNSDVYVANYMPSLTGAPGGLIAPAYPNSTASTSSPTGNYPIYPRPYYQFTCYTHAKEAKGRILLQVRKWNLASELAKGSAGNWNTSGTESDPQSPGSPNDDVAGWQDYSGAGIDYPQGTF